MAVDRLETQGVEAGALPEVSVITPTLHRKVDLEKTCRSIEAQEGVFVEHIVVDGGSQDGSLEWLRDHPWSRRRIETTKAPGVYRAINHGLALAKGRWVHVLGSGDTYTSEHSLQSWLRVCGGSNLTACCVLHEKGDRVRKPRSVRSWGMYRNLCHQGWMFDRLHHSSATFDETFELAADFDLLLKLDGPSARWTHGEEVLVKYQGGGISERRALEALEERRSILRSHGRGPLERWLNELNLNRQVRKEGRAR